ncbi:MAG: hypothetical protein HC887_12350 [Desulfobacteraceae bacterium]|nr:hypothetical protein [Desulfobacteraceae bacterium]
MLFKWINAGSIDSEIEKVKEISLASAGLKRKIWKIIVAKKIDDLVALIS